MLLPKAGVTVYVRDPVSKGSTRREFDDADLRRRRLVTTAEGTTTLAHTLVVLSAEYDRRGARIAPQARAELRHILIAWRNAP